MRVRKFVEEETAAERADAGHVCGVLVQSRPEMSDRVRAELLALPGVEIHHATDDGRLIVTVEDTPESTAGEVMHRFYGIRGLISASLVYHYHDTGDLEGEVSS